MGKLTSKYYTFIRYLFLKYLGIKSNVRPKQIFPNENTSYYVWNIEVDGKKVNSILDEKNNMVWYFTKVSAQKACVKYLIKNYLW